MRGELLLTAFSQLHEKKEDIWAVNTIKWILHFFRYISQESKANEETIWENSDYGENIVQGTGKFVQIMEVFQLQRFGL